MALDHERTLGTIFASETSTQSRDSAHDPLYRPNHPNRFRPYRLDSSPHIYYPSIGPGCDPQPMPDPPLPKRQKKRSFENPHNPPPMYNSPFPDYPSMFPFEPDFGRFPDEF